MKTNNKLIKLSFSLAALLAAQTGFAGGTEAGTVVENTATLSYSVGGAPQSDIVSDVSDFTVDNKVDLNVTGNSSDNIIVGPSSPRSTTGNKLSYTLTNEGNKEQDFEIKVTHVGTDNFDAGTTTTSLGTVITPQAAEACQFTITPVTTPVSTASGPYELLDDPVVTLGIDQKATIDVMCSMPNNPTVLDGHESTIDVLATAVDAAGATMVETAGADNEDSIDIVLADDTGTATDGVDRNAKHSDTQTFEIDTPELSVVKTSEVISDPFNLTTDPKRIPGAIVEYTLTIENTSDSPADDITVTDVLTAVTAGEVEFVASSIVMSPTGAVGNYHATADTTVTPNIAANTVLVTLFDVPANSIETVKFQVKIK